MTNPISNSETLSEVAALSAAVDSAAADVCTAREAAGNTRARRGEIVAIRAQHDADKPATDPVAATELSALLASNPSAAASADWSGRFREAQDAHAAELAAWEGKRTIFDQAIEQLDREGAEQATVIDDATRAHEQAWSAFVISAREAMFEEFLAQFPDFYDRVMGPLDALQGARRIYSHDPVYAGPRRQISHETMIGTQAPAPNGNGFTFTKLYPSPDMIDRGERLTAFRAALVEAQPAPRRAGTKAAGR